VFAFVRWTEESYKTLTI